jgi:peroxiredoxin
VLFFGFLLLATLRAVVLLRWQVAQLEATMPSQVGRSGLRAGKKAPDFTLPGIPAGEVNLQDYARRRLLLVFIQAGCGLCQGITPELNRPHDAGEVQVLVIHNGDNEGDGGWVKRNRPHFPVAVQERFSLSKR